MALKFLIFPALLFICVWTATTQARTVTVSSPSSAEFEKVSSNSSEELSERYIYNDVLYDSTGVEINCTTYIMEQEYVLLTNGSILLPKSATTYSHEQYFLHNDTAYLCAEDSEDESSLEVTTTSLVYHFSREFLTCGHVLIEPDEYKLLSNGSVHIPIYSRVYGPRDYYIQEHGVYVCVPRFAEMRFNMSGNMSRQMNKFSVSFAYVTYVGLLLSIVSLVAHLAVFCAVSSVRNLPGCCLASLSLSLLIAYLCFLTLAVVETTDFCVSLGMCVYYFFLTSFFWMNAIAFDVWRSFRVVMRELRISSHRVPWRRFLIYSAYSWLIPALLAALVRISDTTEILPPDYRPAFGSPICWFGQRKALLLFFAVPLCAVMLLNAVFFLDVTYVISRATLKTSQSHEATLKKRFFTFMRLALIMGLTWIVGLIASYADNQVMWYLFVILNTLQGLFIFAVFSCSSKVRNLCCKRYKNHSKKRGSTSIRTISQISAAV